MQFLLNDELIYDEKAEILQNGAMTDFIDDLTNNVFT